MSVRESDRQLWSARDRALSALGDEGGISTDIRSEIQDSWRRCSMIGITPSTDHVPYAADIPEDNRLRRAAGPVLRRLADQLADSPATILLADRGARIIDRRVGRGDLQARLDAASVAPGFQYAEESSGTNGIGTALEERKLFAVSGGEHFRESLQNLACVGQPIVHPIRHAVEGVLDITSTVSEANSMMGPLVAAAVREIEQRLYEMASRDERALLEEFLRTSRRRTTPVITIGNDLVMANPAASRLLQPADKTLLWEWACERLGSNSEVIGEVRLSEGHHVHAKARRVDDDRRLTGVVLELQEDRPRERVSRSPRSAAGSGPARTEHRPDKPPAIPGFSGAAQLLQHDVDVTAEHPGPTLILGEDGAGKTFVAGNLHQRWSATGLLAAQDLVLHDPGNPGAWAQSLRAELESGATVVLRHLQSIPGEIAPVLGVIVDLADSQGWRLIVTATETLDGPAALVAAHFRRRISVPSLAARQEDLMAIATEILRVRAKRAAAPRLQSATARVLAQRSWPGNIRELESILYAAATRSLGGDIGVQHLPTGYRDVTATRSRSALERAEMDALLTALAECHGNKSLAAEKLGVARSTLYRKVREYGIDTERFIEPH